MQRLNYWQFPGFENVYLEDSYILGIKAKASVEVLVEAVLTENHPLYTQPLPGEQYCYRKMTVKFPHPKTYNLVLQKMKPISEPDGSIDYGNVDEFYSDEGKYYMKGEWGELRIISDPPDIVSEYISIKSGGDTLKIDKNKVKALEWKTEGVINLVYENNAGNILSVQIERQKDAQGFAGAIAYISELEGVYLTQISTESKEENAEISINYSVSAISQ